MKRTTKLLCCGFGLALLLGLGGYFSRDRISTHRITLDVNGICQYDFYRYLSGRNELTYAEPIPAGEDSVISINMDKDVFTDFEITLRQLKEVDIDLLKQKSIDNAFKARYDHTVRSGQMPRILLTYRRWFVEDKVEINGFFTKDNEGILLAIFSLLSPAREQLGQEPLDYVLKRVPEVILKPLPVE